MVNHGNAMLSRKNVQAIGVQNESNRDDINSGTGMMKRNNASKDVDKPVENVDKQIVDPAKSADSEASEKEIADRISSTAAALKDKASADKNKVQQPAARPQAQTGAQAQASKVPDRIDVKTQGTLDDLTKSYLDLFERHFGIKLNASIVFENMRRMCEAPSKDVSKSLYLIENTYRLSTIIYLASNLPILFVSTILSEVNRRNTLKYVTSEVELSAKKYEELRRIRMDRYSEKFRNMGVDDAMTVTPGVTSITKELSASIAEEFRSICSNLKRFNKEMTDLVAGFDANTMSDVIYIYSNWWYFLQGFENVKEIRDYIMLITDDTRKNLKL